MKKVFKLFAGLVVLASVFMLSGCGELDIYKQTYNTWYKYDDANGLNIPLIAKTAEDKDDNSATNYLNNAEVYVYFDGDTKVLRVVTQSAKEEQISLYGGLIDTTQYIIIGGENYFAKEKFGMPGWIALLGTNKFKPSNTPAFVSNPSQSIQIWGKEGTELKIQWQRVLKQYLVNLLLGDI